MLLPKYEFNFLIEICQNNDNQNSKNYKAVNSFTLKKNKEAM